jgi:hypothetical protein
VLRVDRGNVLIPEREVVNESGLVLLRLMLIALGRLFTIPMALNPAS